MNWKDTLNNIKTKFRKTFLFLSFIAFALIGLIFIRGMNWLGNMLIDRLDLYPMTMFWVGLLIPIIISTAFGIVIMALYGHEFWADEE